MASLGAVTLPERDWSDFEKTSGPADTLVMLFIIISQFAEEAATVIPSSSSERDQTQQEEFKQCWSQKRHIFCTGTHHFSSDEMFCRDIPRTGPWWNYFRLIWVGFWFMGDKTRHRLTRQRCLTVFAPYPDRAFFKVWRFSLQHFNGHDPKGPDVHLGVISLSFQDFWSHPVGRAKHCAPCSLLRGQLSTQAKISWGGKQKYCQNHSEPWTLTQEFPTVHLRARGCCAWPRIPTEFHRSVHPEKNIVTFNISVDHVPWMKEIQGFEALRQKKPMRVQIN